MHLWIASCGETIDEYLLSGYRGLLDPAERARESRFYFAADRRQYVIARALVRTTLSRYIRIDPVDWVFSANAYGRPEIASPGAKEAGMSFNVSHTRGLIALGVTLHRALGVDVENFRTRQISMDVANRYFAPEEVADIIATPEQDRQHRFFEYWTLKEAYIKARGMGLSLPLDKFVFRYADPHGVEIVIDPELGDDSTRWHLWQFQPSQECLAAVCAERIGSYTPRLVGRHAARGPVDEPYSFEIVRASRAAGSSRTAAVRGPGAAASCDG